MLLLQAASDFCVAPKVMFEQLATDRTTQGLTTSLLDIVMVAWNRAWL